MNKQHLKLLGYKVRDVVSGFEGVVSTVGFDLYGCVQAVVTPRMEKNKERPGESLWFDTTRLKVLSKKPVMKVPDFEYIPGGQSKPALTSKPVP